MTPEDYRATFAAAVAQVQAAGQPVTYRSVYPLVGGKKNVFTASMKQWKAQQTNAGGASGAGLEPPESADYAEAAPCSLTDGLAEATPPAPLPRQEPRLAALARLRWEAQVALDQAQRRVQEVYRAQQEAQWAARLALDQLHQASRRARSAPQQEMAAACQRVEAAREALASYVGAQAATLAETNHAFVPTGL